MTERAQSPTALFEEESESSSHDRLHSPALSMASEELVRTPSLPPEDAPKMFRSVMSLRHVPLEHIPASSFRMPASLRRTVHGTGSSGRWGGTSREVTPRAASGAAGPSRAAMVQASQDVDPWQAAGRFSRQSSPQSGSRLLTSRGSTPSQGSHTASGAGPEGSRSTTPSRTTRYGAWYVPPEDWKPMFSGRMDEYPELQARLGDPGRMEEYQARAAMASRATELRERLGTAYSVGVFRDYMKVHNLREPTSLAPVRTPSPNTIARGALLRTGSVDMNPWGTGEGQDILTVLRAEHAALEEAAAMVAAAGAAADAAVAGRTDDEHLQRDAKRGRDVGGQAEVLDGGVSAAAGLGGTAAQHAPSEEVAPVLRPAGGTGSPASAATPTFMMFTEEDNTGTEGGLSPEFKQYIQGMTMMQDMLISHQTFMKAHPMRQAWWQEVAKHHAKEAKAKVLQHGQMEGRTSGNGECGVAGVAIGAAPRSARCSRSAAKFPGKRGSSPRHRRPAGCAHSVTKSADKSPHSVRRSIPEVTASADVARQLAQLRTAEEDLGCISFETANAVEPLTVQVLKECHAAPLHGGQSPTNSSCICEGKASNTIPTKSAPHTTTNSTTAAARSTAKPSAASTLTAATTAAAESAAVTKHQAAAMALAGLTSYSRTLVAAAAVPTSPFTRAAAAETCDIQPPRPLTPQTAAAAGLTWLLSAHQHHDQHLHHSSPQDQSPPPSPPVLPAHCYGLPCHAGPAQGHSPQCSPQPSTIVPQLDLDWARRSPRPPKGDKRGNSTRMASRSHSPPRCAVGEVESTGRQQHRAGGVDAIATVGPPPKSSHKLGVPASQHTPHSPRHHNLPPVFAASPRSRGAPRGVTDTASACPAGLPRSGMAMDRTESGVLCDHGASMEPKAFGSTSGREGGMVGTAARWRAAGLQDARHVLVPYRLRSRSSDAVLRQNVLV